MGHYILNSDGNRVNNISEYCPQCGTNKVTRDSNPNPSFDENGWFYLSSFICENPKCKHKWNEKVVVSGKSFRL